MFSILDAENLSTESLRRAQAMRLQGSEQPY